MAFEDGLPPAARRWAVLTTMVGTVMSSLDSNIANVALPAIAKDVHASAAASIWIVNAYQLAVTVTLLSFSSLGDILGYARIYRLALCVFTVASILCATSHSLETLTMARILQGVAASAQMAVSPAINRSLYPKSQLGRAISNSAMAVAMSGAAGPTVAGAILSVAPWPWLFWVNLPAGLIALALASRFLPDRAGTRHRFDVPSAVESALTFGLFVIAIDGFGHGANRTLSILELLAFAGFGFLFIRRQYVLSVPMLAIDLFARPIFSLSIAVSFMAFVAQALAIVTMPFYFEDVLGFSAVYTGLLITPWPLTVVLVAKASGRLADRYPAGILTTIGMAIFAAGLLLIVLLPPNPTPFEIAWRMAICGLGTGFYQSPNNRAIMVNAPMERSGAASGILAMARTTGMTTGAALVALIFGVFEVGLHASRSGVTVALSLAVVVTLVAGIGSSLRLAGFSRARTA
jgi:MFS transporter, DHA2 family, multidrug resistance protein